MKRFLTLLFFYLIIASLMKADTSKEDRIYILSTVWRNVRDNFAFPHHFEKNNPDSLFKAFIPKIMSADSEKAFSLLMTEFLAKFNDGHTRFFSDAPSATVPIKFIGIENKVIVNNINKEYINKIPLGSQLVKIDGQPISEFLQSSIYPYIAAGNNEWKFRKSLDSFLNGEVGTKVTLEFLTPKHQTETITLARVDQKTLDSYTWAQVENKKNTFVKKLAGNILYMRMATFTTPDEVKHVFTENLPRLLNSNGVIFDIRNNRGGTDECWNPIIFDHVAPNDIDQHKAITMKCRVSNAAFQEYGHRIPQIKDFASETAMEKVRTIGTYFSQTPDSHKIKCPIIILINGYTGSAAEDFAVTMKNLNLAKLVGSNTTGVISHPRYFSLPGGYSYGLSTWAFLNPDGTGIIDTGIIPDIKVDLTVEDLINNHDSQLEKAIEILQNTSAG